MNATILQFTYDDDGDQGWHERTDGHGSSLQIVDTEADYRKAANWRPSTEIGGSPLAAGEPAVTGVVINEVLTHTEGPAVDSIELLNVSGAPVELANYYLSDSSDNRDALGKFAIPTTTIPAGSYVVFDESDFNRFGGNNPTDFALSSLGDQVYLTVGDGAGPTYFVDDVSFDAAAIGESLGRWPNGSGPLAPMAGVTLGSENTPPRVGPVVISEINFSPDEPSAAARAVYSDLSRDDLEFIEIYNATDGIVDLSDWRIRGGVEYAFDRGATLPADETLVVLSFNPADAANGDRVAAFRGHYGIEESVRLTGGYAGQLNDDGERIRLYRPDVPHPGQPRVTPQLLDDEVYYGVTAPWPKSAGAGGDSLVRTSVVAWGNLATSWNSVPPSPGQTSLFVLRPGDANEDREFDARDVDAVRIAGKYGTGAPSTWLEGDWDRNGFFDRYDIIAALVTGHYENGPYAARRPVTNTSGGEDMAMQIDTIGRKSQWPTAHAASLNVIDELFAELDNQVHRG